MDTQVNVSATCDVLSTKKHTCMSCALYTRQCDRHLKF